MKILLKRVGLQRLREENAGIFAETTTFPKLGGYIGYTVTGRERKLGLQDAGKLKKRISWQLGSFHEDVKKYRRIINDNARGISDGRIHTLLQGRKDLQLRCHGRDTEVRYLSRYCLGVSKLITLFSCLLFLRSIYYMDTRIVNHMHTRARFAKNRASLVTACFDRRIFTSPFTRKAIENVVSLISFVTRKKER